MRPSFTVAGVQDGSFESFKRDLDETVQHTYLCCVKMVLDRILDVKIGVIAVDGLDSTSSLLSSIDGWDLDAILFGGATFAGFNVVDFEYVYSKTNCPIIVFSPIYPDVKATREALRKHFSDWELRLSRYDALGEIYEYNLKERSPPIYFEALGCTTNFAELVLQEQAITGRVPEAVRVADLIAKGVTPIFRGLMERFGG